MTIDKDFLLQGLLQHNYFPLQKKRREELPPIFGSIAFTPEVAQKLIAGQKRSSSDYQGYDSVDYRLTRFNGISRICSIPHPVAYADLALCLHEHWDKLSYICQNKNSIIRPSEHSDGRVVIMDYEEGAEKSKRHLQAAFGRRFMAHTDIANCYPSVYSHAIPWAVVGFDHAKKHKPPRYKNEWFNLLDAKIRNLKRNETQGIAIGPATSNVITEAILAKVDEKLHSSNWDFFRFVDDYTAYCSAESDARDFIRLLSEELSKYKLLLNIRKTEIVSLPKPIAANWTAELALRLPSSSKITGRDAIHYLNYAAQLAQQTPDGSVLKYALKSLIRGELEFGVHLDVLHYALDLSFHQPILLPLLESLFEAVTGAGSFEYSQQLHRLALENAQYGRSDGMAWSLYYLNKHKNKISEALADKVLASRDCISLISLYLSGDAAIQARVIDFTKSLVPGDLYELDQYWLLLYELFRENKIPNPYSDETVFEILKTNAVSFVEEAATT
jgi:hypothetical protein